MPNFHATIVDRLYPFVDSATIEITFKMTRQKQFFSSSENPCLFLVSFSLIIFVPLGCLVFSFFHQINFPLHFLRSNFRFLGWFFGVIPLPYFRGPVSGIDLIAHSESSVFLSTDYNSRKLFRDIGGIVSLKACAVAAVDGWREFSGQKLLLLSLNGFFTDFFT